MVFIYLIYNYVRISYLWAHLSFLDKCLIYAWNVTLEVFGLFLILSLPRSGVTKGYGALAPPPHLFMFDVAGDSKQDLFLLKVSSNCGKTVFVHTFFTWLAAVITLRDFISRKLRVWPKMFLRALPFIEFLPILLSLTTPRAMKDFWLFVVDQCKLYYSFQSFACDKQNLSSLYEISVEQWTET